MNTESIQEVPETNLEDVIERPVPNTSNPNPTPSSPRPSTSNIEIASNQSRRQSTRSEENGNLISTNDILNHDYDQMKIEEGRIHRMNQKRENSIRNNDDDIFITHVTLNLDIIENRPSSGSTWKYNSIKKNNSFANPAKLNNQMNQRPSTSRSQLSTDSKRTEPFLFLATNRYSTNGSECSENLNAHDTQPMYCNAPSQLSNRTKTRLSSREGSIMNQYQNQNYPRQRVNFEKASTKKARPPSNFSNQSVKHITYMDIIRSKPSADSTSMHSSETQQYTTANKRNNSRQSYSVAEFNKFKNKLLKNHSRNYYQYDSINLNNDYLKSNIEKETLDTHRPIINQPQSQPLFQQGHQIMTDNIDISQKPKPERQLSQIKSIYETIQRANNAKIFSLEMRRSNYLHNMRNTNNILTSSLMVQKI